MNIQSLQAIGDAENRALSEVLVDCVEGGDSIGFVYPMTLAKAAAFWRAASESLARGERAVLAAFDGDGSIVGTVSIVWAPMENQPHRADISKMMVHRRARRRGIGAALLDAVERLAQAAGRTVLVLDTASDDAERLYERGGWQRVGTIPDYALMPDGSRCATTVFFKSLESRTPSG